MMEQFYSPTYWYKDNGVSKPLNKSKVHEYLIVQKKKKKFRIFVVLKWEEIPLFIDNKG